MVESLPSQGMPARDPDHPTAPDESASDRDTESRDDDREANEIAALAARADPVPDEVVEAAKRALRSRRKKSVEPRRSSGSDPA
jgi:hypothetical protein